MNFSSAKKSKQSNYVHYDPEIPTAAKTNYQEFSPSRRQFDTPSLKSPLRCSLKIQQARQSLSNIIGEVSAKKSMNGEAIERVRYTNKEALDLLSIDDDISTYTPKRSFKDVPQKGYHTSELYIPSSPKHYEDPYARNVNEFLIMEDVPNTTSYIGQKSLEAENIELRRALNDQIRLNNELMNRINDLQEENNELRRNAQREPAAGAFGGHTSPGNKAYWKQNHSNNNNQVPASIMRQLDELKRENDMLRKDTINLLQNKKAVY